MSAVDSIFCAAIEIEAATDREAFVERACAANEQLRRQVEMLLTAHYGGGSFLESPVLAPTWPAGPSEGPGTFIGPYKLLERIGEGGMGVVYLAEQQQPVRRRVALKIIRPGLDTRDVIARFEAERQALALMDHPNIAKVLDAGEVGVHASARPEDTLKRELQHGRPYFVMELVRGVPITDYCDQARLSIGERLKLFVAVCRALQHAHQKGIIHRDIKPSNVLVAQHDGAPVPKVIDFGIAKAVGQPLTDLTLFTGFAQLIGTPAYMSPEQASGSGLDIDTRSDVYSLGVLLYELLTGSTPFDRESLRDAGLDEFRRLVREVDPPVPSSRISTLEGEKVSTIAGCRGSEPRRLGQQVRGELDWLVMKALEKDRDRRYESASAFAADVERFLNHEPVLACPPSLAYRARKFVRRNKGPVAAAALVLLTMLGGIVATTWALVAEQQALRESERQRERVENGNGVLLSIFANLERDAEENDGPPLRAQLAERLDHAAAVLLNEEALGDPLAMARLQNGLGNAYVGLGYAAQAVSLLEQALATRREILGSDHADTIDSMNNLAIAYHDAGQLDRAVSLYQEAIRLLTDQHGEDYPQTRLTNTNLASAFQATADYDRALPIYELDVRRNKSDLGPEHAETIGSMADLALCYHVAGQTDKALPRLEETYRLAKEQLGPRNSLTITVAANLAAAYRDAGRPDDALPLLEDSLQQMQRKHGTDHPRTLVVSSNLAATCLVAGKTDRAVELFEETVKLLSVRPGPDHYETAIATHNLAKALQSAGELERALPLFEKAHRLLKQALGDDHIETLAAARSLTEAYLATRRIADALPLFDAYLPRLEEELGPNHEQTLGMMDAMGNACWAANDFQRSVPIYEELLKRRESALGPQHPHTLHTLANLAINYRDAGRQDDALRQAEEFLKRLRRMPPAARDASAWFYKEAAMLFAMNGKSRELGTITFLGLMQKKNYTEAERFLLDAHAALSAEAVSQEDKEWLTAIVEQLVELYDVWEKPDEAAEWRKELGR